MNCPKCSEELARIEVEDMRLDSCASCQGIWFDDRELEQSKDLAEPGLDWMDFEIWKHENEFDISARSQSCPRCEKPMCQLGYGKTGVQVEHCTDCQGIWLDGGEFEKIIQALKNEASGMSSRDLLSAALHEATEIINGPGTLAAEWTDFKHVLRLLKLRFLIERPGLRQAILAAQENSPFH